MEDKGGATAIVKLDNRSRPIPFHKGMIFVKKLSPAWKRLHKTSRDFSEMHQNHYKNKADQQAHEPIARRLRSRQ